MGLCIMLTGIPLLSYWATAGKVAMGLGIVVMACTGSGQGLRALLATAREELSRLSHAWRARRRLWLRRARQVMKPSASISLGWQLSVLLFILVIFVGGALDISVDGVGTAMATASRIALTVALFDLCIMGLRVMRWPWGQSAGKWLKGAVAAIIAGVALGMARHTIANLTGEDPSKFPAMMTLLTGLYVPMAWATIATIIAIITLVPAIALSFCRMIRDESLPAPDNYLLARCVAFMRPILLCIAVFDIGFFATPPDLDKHPFLRYAGVVTLVHMDFWEQAACGNEGVLAARVADNRYLVVDPKAEMHPLHRQTCPTRQANGMD